MNKHKVKEKIIEADKILWWSGENISFGNAKKYLSLILQKFSNEEKELYKQDVEKSAATKRTEIATKRENLYQQLQALYPELTTEEIKKSVDDAKKQKLWIDSKNQSENTFDPLYQKANPKVKIWLRKFLKSPIFKNASQETIDSYFASWIISIVGNGYLKLWDLIIGENEEQSIEVQMENAKWEQLIDFLTKTSVHFWSIFHKPNPNYIKNQLDISKDEFIKTNNEFYNKNNWSDLFNSIWKLINRKYICMPCFATNDKYTIGCNFRSDGNSSVGSCDVSSNICASS